MAHFNNIVLLGYSWEEAASATVYSARDLFPFTGSGDKNWRELFHHSACDKKEEEKKNHGTQKSQRFPIRP